MKLVYLLFFIQSTFAAISIDQSCLDDPAIKVKDITAMTKNLQHNLKLATSGIFWCEYKYPSLRPYLRQWRQAAQNLQISCGPEKQSSLAHFDLRLRLFNPSLSPITLFDNSIKEILTNRFSNLSDHPISTLIHEIFHGTTANIDTSRHNTIESHKPKNNCEPEDSAYDKVSVLESLCSNSPLNSSYQRAGVEVFKKIKRCGIQQGCVRTLTEESPGLSRQRFYFASEGLTAQQALSACQEIYYKAACYLLEVHNSKMAMTEYQQLQYIKSNPDIQAVLNLLRKKQSIIPTSRNFPLSYFERNPNLKGGFDALKNSICFTDRFVISNGSMTCKRSGKKLSDCHPPEPGDSRCVEPTKTNVTKFMSRAIYFTSGFGNLVNVLDIFHDFINEKSVPPFLMLDAILNEKKIRRLFTQSEIVTITTKLRQHYPIASRRSCTQANSNDMKAILEAIRLVPKEPPILQHTECSDP